MPTWTINYRNYSSVDLDQEIQELRSDAACVRLNMATSISEPGVAHIEVEFHPGVTMSRRSAEILRMRGAQAVPGVPLIPLVSSNQTEILMDLGDQQDDGSLQVGLPVYIDEHGRVGSRGSPIGTLTYVDRGANQVRIRIQPGNPVEVREFYQTPSFTRETLEFARDQLQRMPLLDPRVQRARQEIMEAEDARVFEALDAITGESTPRPTRQPKNPEPRPTFKTRYERIKDALKGK